MLLEEVVLVVVELKEAILIPRAQVETLVEEVELVPTA
jgi:hypothetical protein